MVTVGIAVHDGARDIERRIANAFGQAVPFEIEIVVASDGSTDGTPERVNAIAQHEPRLTVLELTRRGQSAAQAAIFEVARGDIVVLTDLETRFEDSCLAALVAPFADPRVGCTTGVLRWHYDTRTHTARDEGLYWRYEHTVRAWESRAGWLSAGTGALLAVRKSLFKPAPAHASLDQMLPLFCRDAGLLVFVARDALGSDRGTASLRDQFVSRTRIATQGIEANLRMSGRISPWRRPGSFLALWSHKLLRWATPIWILLASIAGLVAVAGGHPIWYLAPLVASLVIAALGALAVLIHNLRLVSFCLTVTVVNAAFALAWMNVLVGRRVGAW